MRFRIPGLAVVAAATTLVILQPSAPATARHHLLY